MPTNPEIRARYEAARKSRRARKDRAVLRSAQFDNTLNNYAANERAANAVRAPSTEVGRHLPVEVRRAFPEAERALDEQRGRFVRSPQDLRVVGKSPRAKLARVATHLFARYAVPACVLDAFEGGDAWQRAWFVDLGAGRSVREVTSGFHLSKRAAHMFRAAPRSLGCAGGAWWAKLRALGAARELADHLARLRLFRGEVDERFLEQVAHYIIREQPRRRDLVPLGAYLEGCWREDRSFVLKGKPLDKLVREARTLYGDCEYVQGIFPACGIPEVNIINEARGPTAWRFVELRSPHALRVEGTRMRHCVYQYRHRCTQGGSAIFSLRERWERRVSRKKEQREKGVVTLEVWPQSRKLVQARGHHNRMPTDQLWEVIEKFAALNGLQVTCRPPRG